MDLQNLGSFGIDLSRLRGRVLKARTQPAAEYHVASEVANNASILAPLIQLRSSREKFGLKAPLLRFA